MADIKHNIPIKNLMIDEKPTPTPKEQQGYFIRNSESKTWYGEGTSPKRNTRILDLISDETKQRWKEEEENLKNKKPPTPEEIRKDFEEIKNKPFKEFLVERTPEETGDVFKIQAKSEYNNILKRINNGETITSKDTTFKIQDLQQMLRQDGVATILTIPTRTEGYKLRKI